MERYLEALADFDRAIALNEKYSEAFASRGVTYRLMERFQEALADFDRAIALDEKDSEAFASRGETYRLMERFQEALADFDRAIALDEKYSWAFANRGVTYRLMERFQEALADFDLAIALDGKKDWRRYCRAQVYLLTGQTLASSDDIRTAIELAQGALQTTADQIKTYGVRFNIALYLLFAGRETEAEVLYDELLSTCSYITRLKDAKDDLSDFLIIQPNHSIALRLQTLLQARIDGLTS